MKQDIILLSNGDRICLGSAKARIKMGGGCKIVLNQGIDGKPGDPIHGPYDDPDAAFADGRKIGDKIYLSEFNNLSMPKGTMIVI